MELTYIRFEDPGYKADKQKKGLFIGLLMKMVSKVIPLANPDFDNKIDKVKTWLVSFDKQTGIPQEEIGIDENNCVIVIMPWGRNYGYWTDNNLLINDFVMRFGAHEVTKEEFEIAWTSLADIR